MTQASSKLECGAEEFVITREFDAPRERVWKAHTEYDRLSRWWGPKGFTWLDGKLDLRPGGAFHFGMQGPDGAAMWARFVYREIVAPERLVYVSSFSDPEGNIVRAPFSGDWPLEVLIETLFTERDGKTLMTLRGCPINATEAERQAYAAMHGSMQQGYSGTFDQLEAYMAAAIKEGAR